jgi:hypothetical protein
MSGTTFILNLLFLPETFAPILLPWKPSRGRKLTYNKHYLSPINVSVQICILGSSTSLANSRVDPKEDLVCFPGTKDFTSCHRDSGLFHKYNWSEEALKLEKIAIDSRAWHTWTMTEALRTFKCLKEFVLIVHSSSCRHTLEGNQATDLALKNFPAIAYYQNTLNAFWWLRHGGRESSKRAKPKLASMQLDCDGEGCCLPA